MDSPAHQNQTYQNIAGRLAHGVYSGQLGATPQPGLGLQTLQQEPVQRQLEVPAAVERMAINIQQLEKVISELESRLSLLIRDEPRINDQAQVPVVPACSTPLGNGLSEFAAQIEQQSRHVMTILERLEI